MVGIGSFGGLGSGLGQQQSRLQPQPSEWTLDQFTQYLEQNGITERQGDAFDHKSGLSFGRDSSKDNPDATTIDVRLAQGRISKDDMASAKQSFFDLTGLQLPDKPPESLSQSSSLSGGSRSAIKSFF